MDIKENEVLTGEVRLLYPSLFEKKDFGDGKDAKYRVVLLVPKSDEKTVKAFNYAIESQMKDIPKTQMRIPLRDCDVEKIGDPLYDEVYKNHYFVPTSSLYKPSIYDLYNNELQDAEQIYSGCYARVYVVMYHYNTAGNKGVGCAIKAVQKLKDGERLVIVDNSQIFNDGFTKEKGYMPSEQKNDVLL